MRSKLIIFVFALCIIIPSLLFWSYLTCKTNVALILKTNPKTAKVKLIFCGANLRLIPIGDNKIRLGWSLGYTTSEDVFSDLYVYVSLMGNIYFDSGSVIKKPKMD